MALRRLALGRVSPELAWLQVKTMVQQAILAYPDPSYELAKKMDLRLDFEELTVLLELMSLLNSK
jgi:hypothetical protein